MIPVIRGWDTPRIDPRVEVGTTLKHSERLRLVDLAARKGMTLRGYVREILIAAANRADG